MKHFILLFLFVIPYILFGKQRHLEFSHLPLPNNLPSKNIKCIAEDEKGYLWFGTNRGLFRYDGYEIKKVEDKNVYNLLSDGQGNMWVVGFEGLYKYNLHTEELSRIDLPFDSYVGHHLIKSAKGELIFGSNKGLCIINPETEKVIHYQKIEGLEKGLTNNIVRVIYEDSNQNLWLGTHDQLNVFDRSKNKFKSYRLQGENEVYKKNNLILDIIPLHKENDDILLVGTETGLALFDRRTGKFKKFYHNYSENSLSNNVVKSLCRINKDEIWVGTGNGLNIFNVKNQTFEQYHSDYNNHYSISDDIVTKIYKDKNNTIWLGTNNGIDRITLTDEIFNLNSIKGATSLLERGTTINKVREDQLGNVWFATAKKGLIKYDKSTDQYIQYTAPTILHSDVKDVVIDASQNVWIATPGGLNVLYHDTKNMYAYVADRNGKNTLKTNYLNTISISPEGNVWLSSMKGLYKVDQLENHKLSFKLFRHNAENRNSISGNYVRNVFFNGSENPWVLTGNGVDYFSIETGSISHLQKPEGRGNNYVSHLSFINKDTLLIFYGRNIYQYDIKKRKHEFITRINHSIKNAIHIDGNIWYTTTSRLFKYNMKDQSTTIYSSELTGIDSYRYNSIVFFNKKLYLGGESGFINFVPKEVNFEAQTSSVTFVSLMINNKIVNQGDEIEGKVILEKPFDEIDQLELSYEENSFTINFSTLDFRKDNSLQYYVKLEGLEDEWQVFDGQRNYASYIKVKPGKYIFKVRVTDSFGNISNVAKSLDIVINPPIWATWWAKIIYVVLICVVFYIAHKVTVSNINLQNQFTLEKIKREQDDEVHQLKLKFFTNVSHELRTPLTLITSPLEELKSMEDDQQKQKLINLITRNTERLSRLVNQVLDLRKLDQGAEKLALSNNDIIKLGRNIVHDFMNPALERNINLKFYTNQEESTFMFDYEKLEKVIYNLITNALKYTPNNGEIVVKMDRVEEQSEENQQLKQSYQRIRVIDSGIGISKEVQEKIFERFVNLKIDNFIGQQGTGIGLSLVNDYVKMHNGRVEVSSEEGKGTEFVLYIPIENVEMEDQSSVEETDLIEANDEHTEEVELNEEVEEGKTSPKILLIDDDNDMLSFLVHCFADDYEVITASNGKDGWTQAKKHMPDLIISDWMMPEMNGVELCSKLKTNILTNHIPVIILTAKGGMDSKMIGIENGADDYISKPFNADYLRLRVQNIINQRNKLNERIRRELGTETEQNTMPTFEEKFLNEVIEYIEKNIDNSEFNVKALGECIGMGQTNLYRKIKSMTGMTVNEFIRTIRLKKAGQLLKNGEYNVSDVMYMVGFTHRSYFSKSFKEMYGMTPKEFTKSNNGAKTVPIT